MDGFQGADTESLRQVGTELGGGGRRIGDLAAQLGALVDSVPWTGPDADAFRADVTARVRPGLLECSTRLHREAGEIDGHAAAQDRSSAPEGLGAGAPAADAPDLVRTAAPAPSSARAVSDTIGTGGGTADRSQATTPDSPWTRRRSRRRSPSTRATISIRAA